MSLLKLKLLKKIIFNKYKTFTKILIEAYSTCNTKEVMVERLTEEKEGITVVSLYKPERKNSLSQSSVTLLDAVVRDLSQDYSVRTVILRSLVPDIFCAGADLKERSTLSEQEVQHFVSKLRYLTKQIEELSIPVIAAIDGVALGGGLELALACDIRIASKNSKLGLVETKLGIIPGAGGTQRLPRILNPAVAKELIFTGKIIDGSEAMKLGVVNYAEQQNETKDAAYQKAIELAKIIISNGPISIRMAKKAIDKGSQVDIATGFIIEEACYAQLIPTKDRLEGIKAFFEKRKPNYKGE